MRIFVDVRERALLEAKPPDMVAEVVALDIGDVRLDGPDGVPAAYIERKTAPDWAASLKDGRYHEQKARLLDNRAGALVVYVLEGPGALVAESWQASCVLGMQARDGIAVVTTADPAATWVVVERLCARLAEWRADPVAASPFRTNMGKESRDVKKRDNYTREAVWVSQLACIPGVSLAAAAAIAAIFPTVWDLRGADDVAARLAAIVPDGQKRPLGAARATRILADFGVPD